MRTSAKGLRDSTVSEFLLGLAGQRGGLLRPQEVVEAARPNDSPIHSYFTWDDSEAAEKYRIDEARHLIRVNVQTMPSDGSEVETRVFVSLTSDRTEVGGYRVMAAVLSDEEQRKQLLADALMELRVFERKYRALQELAKVIAPIRKLIQRDDMQQLSRPA